MEKQPAWLLAKQALTGMGGEKKSFPVVEIVNNVQNLYPNLEISRSTIDHQIRCFCVNAHPTHDQFPDGGKSWKKNPIFFKVSRGFFRLYDPIKDKEVYDFEVKKDQEPNNKIEINNLESPEIFKQKEEFKFFPTKVIPFLEKCGQMLGFATQREVSVSMGKVDLVWFSEIRGGLPGINTNLLPVIGFELETSWRTRKHIKGDILNLQNLNCSKGILVLLTSEKDDREEVAALIRNTKNFIQTSNFNVVIWTEEDLFSLASMLKISLDNK